MDFIRDYLRYTKETEPPIIYHRWCAINAIGALLGRSCYINLGHFRIFPNIYTMLIGEPAARKSTAIKISKKLLLASGYETFAADKTTKEKFLLDLEGVVTDEDVALSGTKSRYEDSATAKAIFGDSPGVQEPREVYIAADEFNEFAGVGNAEFYTTLGNMWDWDNEEKPFTQRLKNSRSISIFQPTVSVLGGNTPENFAKAFPPEIIGNGFLSRLLLIHGERSGRKYAFPPVPRRAETDAIILQLRTIRKLLRGEVHLTKEAQEICTDIYHNWPELEDDRFKSYHQRRYTQLLKLALIISASRVEIGISGETILEANTVLAAAETNMPRALGEFGKSKVSDVTNRILSILEKTHRPLSIQELWKEAMRDLDKMEQLVTIMQGLTTAGKVQFARPLGWLPVKQVKKEFKYVDFGKYISEEERGMI